MLFSEVPFYRRGKLRPRVLWLAYDLTARRLAEFRLQPRISDS